MVTNYRGSSDTQPQILCSAAQFLHYLAKIDLASMYIAPFEDFMQEIATR
jgi:hypothetical protein